MARQAQKTNKKTTATKPLVTTKPATKRSGRIAVPAQRPKKVAPAPILVGKTEVRQPRRVAAVAPKPFAANARVMHRAFGPGVVLSVDGDKLEIRFKSAGVKWIIDSYVAKL